MNDIINAGWGYNEISTTIFRPAVLRMKRRTRGPEDGDFEAQNPQVVMHVHHQHPYNTEDNRFSYVVCRVLTSQSWNRSYVHQIWVRCT